MPKITLTVKQEVEVKYLQAFCGGVYWEDAIVGGAYWDDVIVNGVEDTDGTLIPCRVGEDWRPLIELETGTIVNWRQGTEASIHYKVCDEGRYQLLDENRNIVREIEGYVPKIMCPEGNGYGDYVIMKVDAEGKIANWKVDLKAFEDDED